MHSWHFRGLLIAMVVVVAIPAAIALGAGPPTVTTAPATSVTASGAVLNGSVNPEGQTTQYAFQWGPTTGYGHETTLSSSGSGSSAESVHATLSGLEPGSPYHFRVIALSSAGARVGGDESFTTSGTAPAPSAVPTVSVGHATGATDSSVTLNGTVNPEAQATTYYFEYGTTNDYGHETAPVSGGSGSSQESATATLTGLSASTTYHYRLVAYNAGGTALSSDQAVTTPAPPLVATGIASMVADSSAVLNADVNPEGQATTFYFQFGTTEGYGVQTIPVAIGSGTGSIAVHRDPQGLKADTVYHYRVVAQSSAGISYGADQVLKTTSATANPSRLGILGRMAFVARRTGWVGIGVGCFAGQTHCTGRLTIKRGGRVLATRRFSVAPTTGEFADVRLRGAALRLFGSRYRQPVGVSVTAVTSSGQRLSRALRFARWH